MRSIRALIFRSRTLAVCMVVAALFVKALIPNGYMVAQDARTITVRICGDSTGHDFNKQVRIPEKSKPLNSSGKAAKSGCAFSSLGMTGLGGADTIILALALAFILALGFAPSTVASPRRTAFLRPPLRGPPALV